MKILLRQLWNDVPLVFYAFYALVAVHAEMFNLEVQRFDLAASMIFPLLVPGAVYILRIWKGPGEKRPGNIQAGMVLCLGVPALLAMDFLVGRRFVLDGDSMRMILEITTPIQTVVIIFHAWTRNRAMAGLLLGPVAFYGLLLENGGILVGYFEELNYAIYLGPLPAPLATISGWIMVYYLVVWVTWEVRRCLPELAGKVTCSALVATAAAVLLDLVVDPFATAVGLWSWDKSLTAQIFGVPILNFVAWCCAVFPFTWLIFRREKREGLAPGEIANSHKLWLLWRIPLVLAAAAVLFLVTMAILEGGLTGPTFNILRSAAIRYGIV